MDVYVYKKKELQLSYFSICEGKKLDDKIVTYFALKAGSTVYIYIRECASTLYVGLARTAPPTNTNFRLTFLLTQLQEALYEDLAV